MTISVGNLIVAGGATVDTSEVLSALNKQGLKVWIGTKTQRDALPENIKNDDKITFITYDSDEDIYLIVDTIISYSKTWSSVKISTELAKKINSSDVYTKTEVMSLINAKVASALKYRGAVATVAALPSSGQENGDSYYVQADGYMYAWSSDYSDWQALGSATDMTNYYTKSEVDALLADMAVKFQYNVMPNADSTTVGQIIQYTGADTQDYKNGYWYKGVDNGDSTYDWSLHSVGDYYTKSEIDGNFSKSRDMVASSSSVQSLQALLDEAHPELWAPDTYQGSLIINGWGVGTYQAAITDNASANHKVVITGTFSTATDGARPFVATYTSSNVWNIIYTALVSYVDSKISNTVTRHNYSVQGTTDAIADTKALVNHIVTLDVGTYAGEFKRTGITFGSYRLTYFIDGIYAKSVSGTVTYSINANDDATYQVSYVEDIEHGTPPVWKIEKLITSDDIFHVGDRRDIIGWADLTSDVNIDGSSNYANNAGRIDGRNAMILVSNPSPSYQWPVTNSGDRNIFLDFGSYVQFFVDTVNNSLYVRARDSVDMGNWGEIVTKNEMNEMFGVHSDTSSITVHAPNYYAIKNYVVTVYTTDGLYAASLYIRPKPSNPNIFEIAKSDVIETQGSPAPAPSFAVSRASDDTITISVSNVSNLASLVVSY